MKINLINEQGLKSIGTIELETTPEKGEKIIFNDNLYLCINKIHSEKGVGLIVRVQEDYNIIW
jgi:hypothetical protein